MTVSRDEVIKLIQNDQGRLLLTMNLSGIDLSGLDFSWGGLGNLWAKELSYANLTRTVLSGVELSGANLVGVNLRGAIMESINLSQANLRDADLEGAILTAANLRDCNLRNANLKATDLRSSYMGSAALIGANLMDALLDSKTELPDGTLWNSEVDLERFTNPAHPEYSSVNIWSNRDK